MFWSIKVDTSMSAAHSTGSRVNQYTAQIVFAAKKTTKHVHDFVRIKITFPTHVRAAAIQSISSSFLSYLIFSFRLSSKISLVVGVQPEISCALLLASAYDFLSWMVSFNFFIIMMY